MEARLQVIMLIFLIGDMETFLRRSLQVGGGVSVNNRHVVDTIHTLLTEVPDKKVTLML